MRLVVLLTTALGCAHRAAPAPREFHASELDIVERSEPAYPKAATSAKLGDERCACVVQIGRDGVPTAVEVEGCSVEFVEPTRELLLSWRWRPPQDDAGKVAAFTRIVVQYRAP